MFSIFGNSDSGDSDTKTETEERTITKRFTLQRAVVTFPDGSTRNIEYTKSNVGNDKAKFYDHDTDDYYVFNNVPHYGDMHPKIGVDYPKPIIFSMANVQSIEHGSKDEYVVVAEVEVEVSYERDSPDEEWEERNVRANTDQETEFEVWIDYEWEAHNEKD